MNAPGHPHAWWLALLRAPGIGAHRMLAALEATGDAEAAWRSLRPADPPDWDAVATDLAWLEKPGHHLLRFDDPAYPQSLREIPDPPAVLFVIGDPGLLHGPALAIVGSRNPSDSGRENAEAFAEFLAGCGLVIVSGLALGVDTAAHRGALRGGRTVAVVGNGLDRVYPSRNKDLAAAIAESGALVSEFPPGTPPVAENFPQRNRIISGLAVGTLVVEATSRSGSLITARMATEQGREVFAIPGSIHNPMAKGCHQLIRQGAKLVDSAEHVLEEIGPSLGIDPGSDGNVTDTVRGGEQVLDEEYEKLLECMDDTPLSVDRLVARSGLTPEIVSSMLLIMELRGLVRTAPGGGYAKRPKGNR